MRDMGETQKVASTNPRLSDSDRRGWYLAPLGFARCTTGTSSQRSRGRTDTLCQGTRRTHLRSNISKTFCPKVHPSGCVASFPSALHCLAVSGFAVSGFLYTRWRDCGAPAASERSSPSAQTHLSAINKKNHGAPTARQSRTKPFLKKNTRLFVSFLPPALRLVVAWYAPVVG